MQSTSFKIQLAFTNSSEKTIRQNYNISDDDDILATFWVSSSESSIWQRKGFVFTKKGFAWNHPATAENTDISDGMKDISPRNQSFLKKENITFLGTSTLSSEEAARQDCKSVIQLKTSGTLYTYTFDSGIPKEKLAELEHAISAHFSDVLNPNTLTKNDAAYSFEMTVLAIKDFFVQTWKSLQKKAAELKEKFPHQKAEKKHIQKSQKENSAELNKTDKSPKNTSDSLTKKIIFSIGNFIRHITDLCVDLMLIFAIIIFVKPELIEKNTLSFFYDSAIKILFFIRLQPSEETIFQSQIIFITLGILWIILKTFISLSCRKNRKTVTFLLLAMSVAAALVIAEKFLVFAILLILILFALQFSMGFSVKVVKTKSILFVICCLAGYLALHIIFCPDFTDLLASLKNALSFQPHWW